MNQWVIVRNHNMSINLTAVRYIEQKSDGAIAIVFDPNHKIEVDGDLARDILAFVSEGKPPARDRSQQS